MHLYRAAWHRLAPLATRGALLRTAPVRRMSSTSVPGSSGEALPYYLFTGAAFTGGLFYVYRTLSTDQERFRDRHAFIDSQQKEDHSARSSGKTGVEAEASYVTEACEEATESITVEAVAVAVEDVPEEEVISSISVEQEQPVTEEQELVPLAEEEIAASSEAAPLQVSAKVEKYRSTDIMICGTHSGENHKQAKVDGNSLKQTDNSRSEEE
uniref:Protein MGARP N-terminal domain-containing protein n=1 Tax=Leptobrachium leishanense TaxID=445787 RepID=A0A8C5P8I8_9ANUR